MSLIYFLPETATDAHQNSWHFPPTIRKRRITFIFFFHCFVFPLISVQCLITTSMIDIVLIPNCFQFISAPGPCWLLPHKNNNHNDFEHPISTMAFKTIVKNNAANRANDRHPDVGAVALFSNEEIVPEIYMGTN